MSDAYRQAGVDIEAGDDAARRYAAHAARTLRPEVLTRLGGFGGGFALPLDRYPQPVLVSGADGVGTKLKLAFALGKHDTVGIDCVAMCVNDILVMGAEPLFFLDYFATGRLDPAVAEAVVAGVAEGCARAGCALIGGETAEMPGMYADGEYDLAGFTVGVVNRDQLIDGSAIEDGDAVIGLASSGVHSNGFSLVRTLIADAGLSLDEPYDEVLGRYGVRRTRRTRRLAEVAEERAEGELTAEDAEDAEEERRDVMGTGHPHAVVARPASPAGLPTRETDGCVLTLGEVLLEPTRIYVRAVLALLRDGLPIRGMAHITGGGLTGNLPRVLHRRLDVALRLGAWEVPPIFALLARLGNLTDDDLFATFNMGVGLALAVPESAAEETIARAEALGERAVRIGTVLPGTGVVRREGTWR
ncbi:MAG TPA: phosphoribosylformylglycinamidine cyclo-ligase [Ktedonobacterales bacterium]